MNVSAKNVFFFFFDLWKLFLSLSNLLFWQPTSLRTLYTIIIIIIIMQIFVTHKHFQPQDASGAHKVEYVQNKCSFISKYSVHEMCFQYALEDVNRLRQLNLHLLFAAHLARFSPWGWQHRLWPTSRGCMCSPFCRK